LRRILVRLQGVSKVAYFTVFGLCRNAEDGPKDKQDCGFFITMALNRCFVLFLLDDKAQ